MIISIYPTDILIVHDWKIKKIIYKIEPGNFNKHWLRPLPDFDLDKYPFLISSGREFYSLINVKTMRIEKFIHSSCVNVRC